MWQLGKHCPFRAGGEILELPVNRKKRVFSHYRAAVSSGGKCWVLRIDSDFAVSHWQHHPGAFSSLFPSFLQKQILKKKKKKTQHICASSLITDRCLFGPVMVLVSFFLSYLTVGLLACLPLCSLEQSGFG